MTFIEADVLFRKTRDKKSEDVRDIFGYGEMTTFCFNVLYWKNGLYVREATRRLEDLSHISHYLSLVDFSIAAPSDIMGAPLDCAHRRALFK